jgi:alpha-methylacyl-CoA racemase
MPGALEGVRILDLTRLLPGAVATLRLADEGAEVIKIEQPPVGDYARASYEALFELTNRGKKSVEIDLKSQKESFLKLVLGADVLIEGFRPGVMERLGLGYEVLKSLNPRLIYVALTGYGPQSLLAGHDLNYLAMSGVLDLIRAQDGTPVIPGVQIADLAGGSMQAMIGILVAILERERTGVGKRVDVSMTDGLEILLPVALAERAPRAGRQNAPRAGRRAPVGGLLSGRYACYHVYAAAEGSFVAVGALEEKFWGNLCRELGCPELVELQFAADQAPVIAAVGERFKAASAEVWFSRIGDKDCCVTPVRIAAHGAAPLALGRAPRLGKHNGEFL